MPPTLMCPIVFDFELRNETKMKRQIVLHIINTDEKSTYSILDTQLECMKAFIPILHRDADDNRIVIDVENQNEFDAFEVVISWLKRAGSLATLLTRYELFEPTCRFADKYDCETLQEDLTVSTVSLFTLKSIY